MAIELTTEIPVPNATYQGISKIEYFFPHSLDQVDGGMKLNKVETIVIFHVTTWLDDGTELKTDRYSEIFNDWPANFLTDTKAVYSRLEQYAIAQGYMGDGIAEDISAP